MARHESPTTRRTTEKPRLVVPGLLSRWVMHIKKEVRSAATSEIKLDRPFELAHITMASNHS
jgi:hypothetical protein